MTRKYKDKIFLVKCCNWFNFFPEKLPVTTVSSLFKNQLNNYYVELFGNSKELPPFDNIWEGCKIKAKAELLVHLQRNFQLLEITKII